ncbi:MAG TPA: protein kinase [Myxococcota bacterium]|nr:protein kinase [Myxococcota bacterium]
MANRLRPDTLGKYKLLKLLNTGGMAEIYLARQTGIEGFERLVVVKRILPHLARDKSLIEMFLDEARIAAKLYHPNIVQIFDLGNEDGEYYIVMEYLEGESLDRLVAETNKISRFLSPELAAGIMSQVCEGLYYAHSRVDTDGKTLNIIHRDVSPQNIFVLFTGTVKLVDFGIAKAADKIHKTRTGQIKGKWQYMSPEQCKGQSLDARSDIFSLGVVLWELLTHSRLFKRKSDSATVLAIVQEPIPRVREKQSDVPAELADIADRALKRKPADRFQDVGEMGAALMKYIRESGQPADYTAISDFAGVVLADQARASRQLLSEIQNKEAKAASLGVLKTASESLPPEVRDASAGYENLAGEKTKIRYLKTRRAKTAALVVLVIVVFAFIGGWYLWQGRSPVESEKPPLGKTDDKSASAGLPAIHDGGESPVKEKPETVAVRLVSVPPGATVRGEKKILGKTPIDLQLAAGEGKTVTLEKTGYQTVRQIVSMKDAPLLSVELKSSRNRKRAKKKKGTTDKTRVAIREAEERAKSEARILYYEAYVIKGTSPEEAKKKLERVLLIVPKDSVYRTKSRNLLAKLGGDDVTPAPDGKRPKKKMPTQVDADEQKSRKLREEGIRLYKKGQLGKAIDLFKKALELNPKDHELLRLIGSTYALGVKRKEAYEYYKLYVATCPKCRYAPSVRKILKDYEDYEEYNR